MRFLIAALFQIFLACQTPPKQDLLTDVSWKLVGVVARPLVASKRDSIPPEPPQKQSLDIIYTFQKNKKYQINRASQIDKGDWGLSSDEKVLLLRSLGQVSENSEFRIHRLQATTLVMSSEHKTKQEILYFIPR
jgi:hypothetical protein